ncbi:MAG TPA: hypothetical protein VHD84_03310 [Candidatus Saccharimonadales bacterium]|nr:hypothetical protein [Candidatus Saccharimonadales bacterium]
MKLYRFSPIKNQEELLRAIEYIHFACYRLCNNSFGKSLPNAGNVGVFCHYDEEYATLTELRKGLTEASDNFNQKYFRLHKPITIAGKDNIPETTYAYLYIRKPDPYRSQVGDIDFYLEPEEHSKLKKDLPPGARLFDRQDLDMVELYDPDVDALAYVSDYKMTEKVRTKQ